jgi:hypothetical protein
LPLVGWQPFSRHSCAPGPLECIGPIAERSKDTRARRFVRLSRLAIWIQPGSMSEADKIKEGVNRRKAATYIWRS